MRYNSLISVIVPVYNVEQYIKKCIDSLVNQTYRNLEIILVDDGSTDSSGQICSQYALLYQNVFCYHKSNGGLSEARNFGLSKARGEFIGFIDSDDYVDELFYETLLNDIYLHDADIATVGFQMIYSNDEKIEKKIGRKTEVMTSEEAIPYLFNNKKFCNFAWNKLYKRELFNKVIFPVGKKMEDLGTTYKLMHKANIITYNPSHLYYYYQRDNSILHNIKKGFYEDKLELSKERYTDLKQWYPKMKENTVYYLKAIFDCIEYIDPNSDLVKETIASLKKIDKKAISSLTLNRKVKYILITGFPRLFFVLFKKNYDN